MHKKLSKIAALILATMLMMSACVAEQDYPPELLLSQQKPAPPPVDKRSLEFEAELYFISADGRRLYSETQSLLYGGGVSKAYAAVEALQRGPETDLLQPCIPNGIELERVVLSVNVATVYFAGEFPNSMASWLIARAAIAATLYAVEDVTSVNVLLNGLEPGYGTHALGEATLIDQTLDVYIRGYEQMYGLTVEQLDAMRTSNNLQIRSFLTLYYIEASGDKLKTHDLLMTYTPNRTKSQLAMDLIGLLSADGMELDAITKGLRSPLPYGFSITGPPVVTYYTGDTYQLNININEPSGEYDERMLCAAITLTMVGFMPNVRAVSISKTDKQGENSPVGKGLYFYTDFLDLLNEEDIGGVIEAGESLETHTATLFFAEENEGLLLAESREITYPVNSSRTEVVDRLLQLLAAGSSGASKLQPVLPADFKLASSPKLTYTTTTSLGADSVDGPCIVSLDISTNQQGLDTERLSAAITLTLTGFVPKLEGVVINITTPELGYRSLGEHPFIRSDFENKIGRESTLYFPSGSGGSLVTKKQVLPSTAVHDTNELLKALFNYDTNSGYLGFTQSDIKNLYITDGIAVVNWTSGFYEKLNNKAENISLQQLSAFIYGIVNTLTEIEGVNKVWMLENGERLGIVKTIFLGNPLLRNPGIISEG